MPNTGMKYLKRAVKVSGQENEKCQNGVKYEKNTMYPAAIVRKRIL
ncbi:MAG: hypothetical protein U1C71_01035 [archaeon]|nr:hypothetical protein [archaeon]